MILPTGPLGEALQGASVRPVSPVRIRSQSWLVAGRFSGDESPGELLKGLRAAGTLRVLDDVRVIPVVED
jgi:hypothetical protein